jgi:HK97 family phage portal protein
VKSPWAWFRDIFAREHGEDPTRIMRYVLPYPIAGLNLAPDEILSLSAVWACIDAIARGIGPCDWNVYRPVGGNKNELLIDDRLAYLLNVRPNPEMTAIGFREGMLFTAVPFGNAYAEIVPDGAGRPAQLWPLAQDRVMPRRDRQTWELYYEYREPITGTLVRIPQNRIFQLRGPGLYGLLGENLIARAAKSMAVAAAQERYAASYFGQGANPGGILTYPGKMSKETYDRLKEDWAEKKKGPENAHKPMIIEGGMTYVPTTNDPQKSQAVESRQFSVEEICRWFGVPPHKVQHLLHATFSNIEHQSIEFVRDALTPWCRRLEQEANYKFFPQDRGPWRFTKIDTLPLTAGDFKSRADGYAIMRQNGVMSANEIRDREGMNHIGADGDVLLANSTLAPMERLLRPPDPAPAPAPATDPKKEPAPADDVAALAREALDIFVCGALERFRRRLDNRRADLARNKTVDVAGHMVRERDQAWPRLLAELEPAKKFAARALGRQLQEDELKFAAELVVQGELPAAATAKALPATCPRST